MPPARLKARMDSLLSFSVGLFHPLQHAGLSRRSPVSRPLIQNHRIGVPLSGKAGLMAKIRPRPIATTVKFAGRPASGQRFRPVVQRAAPLRARQQVDVTGLVLYEVK